MIYIKMLEKNESIFRPENNCSGELRWKFVHKVLKYGLLTPILKLFFKVYSKYLINKPEDIPYEKWNNMVHMFNYAFDKSIIDWKELFLKTKGNTWRDEQLVMLKNLLLTIYMEDIAYRELFNLILMNFNDEMNFFYSDNKKAHMFYVHKYNGYTPYFKWWNRQPIKVWKLDKPRKTTKTN